MATIGEICNREVVVTTRDTSITAAAKLMRHFHVGTLVIVDPVNGGKRIPVGIVTDRDIVVELVATELDPGTITVGDIMVHDLITARESEGVLETMELMRHKGVRRLPIVTGDGGLVGIVSIDDLLEILAEQLTDLTKIVARERAREAEARITVPRAGTVVNRDHHEDIYIALRKAFRGVRRQLEEHTRRHSDEATGHLSGSLSEAARRTTGAEGG